MCINNYQPTAKDIKFENWWYKSKDFDASELFNKIDINKCLNGAYYDNMVKTIKVDMWPVGSKHYETKELAQNEINKINEYINHYVELEKKRKLTGNYCFKIYHLYNYGIRQNPESEFEASFKNSTMVGSIEDAVLHAIETLVILNNDYVKRSHNRGLEYISLEDALNKVTIETQINHCGHIRHWIELDLNNRRTAIHIHYERTNRMGDKRPLNHIMNNIY